MFLCILSKIKNKKEGSVEDAWITLKLIQQMHVRKQKRKKVEGCTKVIIYFSINDFFFQLACGASRRKS